MPTVIGSNRYGNVISTGGASVKTTSDKSFKSSKGDKGPAEPTKSKGPDTGPTSSGSSKKKPEIQSETIHYEDTKYGQVATQKVTKYKSGKEEREIYVPEKNIRRGSLSDYAKRTGSKVSIDTLKRSRSLVDITGLSGKEAINKLRSATKNIDSDDSITVAHSKSYKEEKPTFKSSPKSKIKTEEIKKDSFLLTKGEKKGVLQRIKEKFIGKAQRGEFGEGLQQYLGQTQSATMPRFDKDGKSTGKGTTYTLPQGDAINIAKDLVLGASTGRLARGPLLLLSKALPKVAKAGSILYIGDVGIRFAKTEKDPTKILKEFSKDIGFIGGIKVGNIKYDKIDKVKVDKKTGRKILNKEFGNTKKPPSPKQIKAKFKTIKSESEKAKIIKSYIKVYKKIPDIGIKLPKRMLSSKKASYSFVSRPSKGKTRAQKRMKKPTSKRPTTKAEKRKQSLKQAYSRKQFFDEKRGQVGKKIKSKGLKKAFVKERVLRKDLKTGKVTVEDKGIRTGQPSLKGPEKTPKKSKLFPKGFGSQAVPKSRKTGVDFVTISNKDQKLAVVYKQLGTKLNKIGEIQFSKRKPIKKPETTGRLILINSQQAKPDKPLKIDLPKRSPEQKPQLIIRGFRPGKSTDKLLNRVKELKEKRQKEKLPSVPGSEIGLKNKGKVKYDIIVVPEYSRLPPTVERVDIRQLPSNVKSEIRKISPDKKYVELEIPKLNDRSLINDYLKFKYSDKLSAKESAKIINNFRSKIRLIPLGTIKRLAKEGVISKQDIKIKEKLKSDIEQKIDEKPQKIPKDAIVITKDLFNKIKNFKRPKDKRPRDDYTTKTIRQIKKTGKDGKVTYIPQPIFIIDTPEINFEDIPEDIKKEKKFKIINPVDLRYTPTLASLDEVATRTIGKFTGLEERGGIVKSPIVDVATNGKTREGRRAKVKNYRRRIPAVNSGNIALLKKNNLLKNPFKR